MITAQDIREKAFDTSRLGGYDKAQVDDFLEDLAAELTNAQKENSVLKSKMKVLVDKIEEYRSNEEALNLAVLSAQKLAVQIENDARARASNMIADAENQVSARIGSIAGLADAEEKRLADAKAANQKFFDGIRSMCAAQMKNLDAIANGYGSPAAAPASAQPAPAAAPAASIDETVRTIESNVARIQPEPDFKIDLSPAMESRNNKRNSFDNTQPFSF